MRLKEVPAYLVAHLDTTATPPRVVRCDIYSERAYHLTNGITNTEFAVGVLEVCGKDFQEARDNLVNHLKYDWNLDYSVFGWLRPFLPDLDNT